MNIRIIFISIQFIFLSLNLTAQKSVNTTNFSKEDSAAINALALYPDSVRLNIFEASQYPELLVRLSMQQEKSAFAFRELLASKSREEQEELWNLSRYPELITALVKDRSVSETDKVFEGYPEEVKGLAMKHIRNNPGSLKSIDSLNKVTGQNFETLLSGYTEKTKRAYRELLSFPEVLSILNDHLDIAVMAGAEYKRNPENVIHFADSVSLAVARQNAEELSQWKDSVQKDTNNLNDLKALAGEYSSENGSSENEIKSPAVTNNVIVHYNYYPYPYWYGYPFWYPEPYWYPVPVWVDLGFYYDPFGNIIIIGMPSYRFVHWYFYHPHHWHHHPHIGHTFVSHYYGHRNSIGSNFVVVNRWVDENKKYLPRDFIRNKTNGIETMKELGQLNTVKDRSGKDLNTIQRDEYYEQNKSNFPVLKRNNELVKSGETKIETETKPVIKDRKTPNIDTRKPEQYNDRQKAQDYHREEWESTSPKVKTQPKIREMVPKEKVQPKQPITPKPPVTPRKPDIRKSIPDKLAPAKPNPQPEKRK